jgi:phosphatidylglycerophosphate synthase
LLDSYLRKYIDPPLKKIAAFSRNLPITPNHVTLGGFLIGAVACFLAMLQLYWWALLCLVLNRLFDGLDGAVARIKNQNSDFGGYLDITLDFFIYGGFPLCIAIGLGTSDAAYAAAFLLFCIITTGTSFLAYAIIAAKNNMETEHQGKKSFYFSNGLMEGTETILFMCLMCILPQYFVTLCIIFGVLCLITTAMRIYMASQVFK